jgi:hypothetical protein
MSSHQALLAPAPGAGAWPIVVFSHGLGCNRFAYSKVQYLMHMLIPLPLILAPVTKYR